MRKGFVAAKPWGQLKGGVNQELGKKVKKFPVIHEEGTYWSKEIECPQ